MSQTDYGSPVFAGWRHTAAEDWRGYVDHAFVRGLADGSLPRAAFLTYLVQDYIFLVHFARAWALAVVKSESVEEMRTAAATVNALINEEIQLHVGICAREGIPEDELFGAQEAPENLAYTRYVMDTGISGDLLDLLAVLAPCIFGYGEIGLNLTGSHDTTPLYREWIDTYAGDEYQDSCRSVSTLVERVARSRLGPDYERNPRWDGLCGRFTTATRLETDFWAMGLRSV